MSEVRVRFCGAHADMGDLARRALQPFLDSVYRSHCWKPLPEVEEILRRAGRGAFVRDNTEMFARYIAAGDRPVLTG